jgi:hypothetical protein
LSRRLSPICRTADLSASAAPDGDAGVDVGADLYANGALDAHFDRRAHGHRHLARHPNRYGRANANADAGYGNAGADADANTRSHAYVDGHAHSEFDSRTVPDPIRHDDDRADRDSRGANADADRHPCAYRSADRHPCAYCSADDAAGAAYCHNGGDRYHASYCDIHS